MATMTVREFRSSTAQAWEALRRDGEVVITSNGRVFGRLVPPRSDQAADQAEESRVASLAREGRAEVTRREAEFWEKLVHPGRHHPGSLRPVELSDDEWTAFWDVARGE